jgi:hypothetical protein
MSFSTWISRFPFANCLRAFGSSRSVGFDTPVFNQQESVSTWPPKSGEFWLLHRLSSEPVCVLPASHSVNSPHKLVFGPAGSGRSMLMARLALAAHEAGNLVVVLDMRGARPLYQLTQHLGGTTYEITSREHVDALLAAKTERVAPLFNPVNRFLYIAMGSPELFTNTAISPEGSLVGQATAPVQQLVWQMLQGLDRHLASTGRRLTVIINELEAECLNEACNDQMRDYLASAPALNRDTIWGWLCVPDSLFNDNYPAALTLLEAAGTQFLLGDRRYAAVASCGEEPAGYDELLFSTAEKHGFCTLSHSEREVLVRFVGSGGPSAVYRSKLSAEVLSPYLIPAPQSFIPASAFNTWAQTPAVANRAVDLPLNS